jgi:gamma-butyrobetaine dioxygenase
VADEPITPDFYRYRWRPIVAAHLHRHEVTVQWVDGVHLDCHALWLAENADGVGLDPVTRESVIDPGELPDPGDLVAADVDDRGALVLGWRSGTVSVVHPGWLRHIADGNADPQAYIPTERTWTAADLAEPPTFDGSRILEQPEVLADWLDAMVRFGLARLRTSPRSSARSGDRTSGTSSASPPIWSRTAPRTPASTWASTPTCQRGRPHRVSSSCTVWRTPSAAAGRA